MSQGQASEKLRWWQKVGYGLGDVYNGGAGTLISLYYLFFLTNVVRIDPALAGTVFLISKGYDAITDPFEGVIADRTRTRMGRRRPYLLAGIPLVFLSFSTLFFPIRFASELGRFAFVVFAYLFSSTVSSIVMLNQGALQAELTLDYDERTKLGSARIFFSTLASIVAAVVPLEIVKAFDDMRVGYIVMGAAFGLFFALPFVATVLATRERPEFQRPLPKFDWRQTYLAPFRVRTYVYALLMYLLSFVAIDTLASIVVYYVTYYLRRGGEASFVNGTLLITQVAILPFYAWLSRRTSKRTGFIVGAAIWMAAMLASLLVTPDAPGFVMYVFAAAVGTGAGGVVTMIFAIFPDIPDVDELQSGERREGIYFSLAHFTRKLSTAVALFLVGNALKWFGYREPVDQVIDGVVRQVEQPQPDTFILGLRLLIATVPFVLLATALLVAWRYPLTASVHERLNRILAARRAGKEDADEQRAEAAQLTMLLIGPRQT